MSLQNPRVGVTPPAFCKSSLLRNELARVFPGSKFNDRDRYLSESELIEFLNDVDAAIVGRDPVTEKVVNALPRLKIVAKYGVGVDTVDRDALERRRVAIGWTPGVNRLSVAELTIGFMIGLCHNAFRAGDSLKRSAWQKDGGSQLTGKTVGMMGCGHVGMEVVRLLSPFSCRLLVCDILDKSDFCRNHGAVEAGFEEMLEQSDIVSLHVPLTHLTRNVIDAKVFQRMKETAFLVNTSRGRVVDQEALKTALREGFIAGAALDVFAEEPPNDPDFLSLPNLMVTPHIGGNSREAIEAMGRAAIQHLVKYFQGEE